jgi:L-alanine-DL-glutamate epimerase-like enolase superfamily enzyme
VKLLNQMQERGLDIELVEQPVKAHDLEGLKYVTDRSYVPVLADESVFSVEDALKIVQLQAADLINIKLMKCGGLTNALKIATLAEVSGVECMIGCMLEAKVSVNAAVHLACARQIITKVDLDGPVLCSEDPVLGGAVFNEKEITVADEPGLGIRGIEGIQYLDD